MTERKNRASITGMKNILIIADIAGEFDALMRLVAQVPEDTLKLSLGDMCDRGPKSKEVFEYFMGGPDRRALQGNHEHMLLAYYEDIPCRMYEEGIWMWNGGDATLASYGETDGFIPHDVRDWIKSLPLFYETDDLFVSHAPWPHFLERQTDLSSIDVFEAVWNRAAPRDIGKLQVFGHNSHWGLRSYKRDDGVDYALCIDQCRTKRVLTGYLWPEGKIIEVPFEGDQDATDSAA